MEVTASRGRSLIKDRLLRGAADLHALSEVRRASANVLVHPGRSAEGLTRDATCRALSVVTNDRRHQVFYGRGVDNEFTGALNGVRVIPIEGLD